MSTRHTIVNLWDVTPVHLDALSIVRASRHPMQKNVVGDLPAIPSLDEAPCFEAWVSNFRIAFGRRSVPMAATLDSQTLHPAPNTLGYYLTDGKSETYSAHPTRIS